MPVQPIRLFGDPVLRTPADPVIRFDAALARLIEDLLDTVQEPGRAGLAANQIGSSLAAFAYNVEGQLGYLINPSIVELEGEDDGLEGCLSVPGYYDKVTRPATVRVRAQNELGEHFEIAADGMLAVCIQHEMDHLIGKVFVDHLSPLKRARLTARARKKQRLAG